MAIDEVLTGSSEGHSKNQMALSKPLSEMDKNAGFVMATNSSSIVSKRSVERLYHEEPHYFRYFVKKPQRRAPVINRGYWLRMEAIEHVIRSFFHQSTDNKKVVINLGCGYDPMPFQWLGQKAELCKGVTFIDIDYRDLMLNKVNIINSTPQIKELLGNVRAHANGGSMIFQSDRYSAVGCDLGDTNLLDRALQDLPWLRSSSVLFVAEVSITYMEVRTADRLIEWAAKVGSENQFCLLEQFLPDGTAHPFAKTMLRHFKKLRSPLKCIERYPSIEAQRNRFRNRGWGHAEAQNLWALWSNDSFLPRTRRLDLERIEPFDEWEEFALFASHYFLLHASTTKVPLVFEPARCLEPNTETTFAPEFRVRTASNTSDKGLRKHGAAFCLAEHIVGHHGGADQNGRSSTADLYSDIAEKKSPWTAKSLFAAIPPRLCHTITKLHNGKILLVGGRTSPSSALPDCYILHDQDCQRIQDLPSGRYRHCTTAVSVKHRQPGVLVFGGKENASTVVGDWLLWDEDLGWVPLKGIQDAPPARFGASLLNLGNDHGILFGGMSDDSIMLQDVWSWHIVSDGCDIEGVYCQRCSNVDASPELLPWLGRFGSTVNSQDGKIMVIGGIAQPGCLPQAIELLSLCFRDNLPAQNSKLHVRACIMPISGEEERPLLVGHSSVLTGTGQTLILGGGAVCFSFGSQWNTQLCIVEGIETSSTDRWTLLPRESAAPVAQIRDTPMIKLQDGQRPDIETKVIDRRKVHSAAHFTAIIQSEQPCVLEDLDFGPCVQRWTHAYLREIVGSDRQIIVHEASSSMMNFHAKDFKYVTRPFGEFLAMAEQGSNVYLRSLSLKSKSDLPAQFHEDFPGLAPDFSIPSQLRVVSEKLHSSPFRISTAGIWLHYDVQANCLFQIRGSKRLILFPPQDILRLDFAPGSTTSELSVFDASGKTQHIAGTGPVEVHLNQGDVLFIPPLWPHTAAPVQGVSVAINAFFRNLDEGYAAGRDVYGNRDLQPYENGRKQLDKIVNSFARIPPALGRVYLHRLAEELRSKVSLDL